MQYMYIVCTQTKMYFPTLLWHRIFSFDNFPLPYFLLTLYLYTNFLLFISAFPSRLLEIFSVTPFHSLSVSQFSYCNWKFIHHMVWNSVNRNILHLSPLVLHGMMECNGVLHPHSPQLIPNIETFRIFPHWNQWTLSFCT